MATILWVAAIIAVVVSIIELLQGQRTWSIAAALILGLLVLASHFI